MRRLYVQVYITIAVSLLLVVVSAGAMWRMAARTSPATNAFEFASQLASAVLPPKSRSADAQTKALEKFARSLHTDLSLYDENRRLVAAAGRPLPPPQDWRETGGWMHVPGGHAWSIALEDGRWLVMRAPHRRRPRHPAIGLIAFLGMIASVVALAAYPVVRRLTRRLERLEAGVVSLGSGNLKARVPVEGRDEIAGLAESFNRAAGRIEGLVDAHKMLLANASHELRTPLARIRLGLELQKEKPSAAREADLKRDIAELDALIDEILLSSRLDTLDTLDVHEDIDLLGLAAEECARYDDCQLDGKPVTIHGDPRLLRRMIRNLLENAKRHGRPPIEVTVNAESDQARLRVSDHGDGIAPAARDRIFEPFHHGGQSAAGTGLGLALVRQIARRHGGDASLGPYRVGGSTFEVILPLPSAAKD